jgi:hypothetical protein
MLDHSRSRKLGAAVLAVPCLTVLAAEPAVANQQVLAETLCGKYASTTVEGGSYIVQNNVWGADTAQCIEVNGASFTVTTSDHDKATNGAPAGYPSIYAGCHYENCTVDSGLPLQVGAMDSVRSSWSTVVPQSGTFNVAYDLWFDPNPRQPAQNAGELMIWIDHQGPIQPIGSPVGTVNLAGATWEVWTGNIGWNVISYIRTQPTSAVQDLDLTAFSRDAVRRGSIGGDWYLTSVQAGFEPWQGGQGLATNAFSVSTATSDPGDGDPGDGGDPGVECTTEYNVQNSWNSGYVAEVTVRNTSGGDISGWSLGFTNPASQRVTSAWNATVSQQGDQVTATGDGWNRSIPAGGSVTFGIQGTHSGSPSIPTDFTLNGSPCD